MASRSLVLLAGLFVLLLLMTSNHPMAAPLSTVIKATTEATAEPTLEATSEANAVGASAESTEAATAESATAEATAESSAGLVGDPMHGQFIFEHGLNSAPACSNCHSRASKTPPYALAPSLHGIAQRAATRIPGMTAPQYIEDSIRHPADYVVSGFHAIMYSKFAQDYSDQDIADIIAYLMTL